nr:FkbM family methyltransferase [Mesorhizobium camelthorni]
MESIPSKAPVFVDLGSALGYYSVLVKKISPKFRVISVDPNPFFHKRHAETVKLNGLAEGDIELVKKAVYSRAGHVSLADKNFGSFVCDKFQNDGEGINVIEVESVTIEELVEAVSGHIDFMKMDIQGAELDVFRSVDVQEMSNNVSNIIIGTHGKVLHDEILKLLSTGYRIAFEDHCPEHQPDGIIVAHSRRRRY